MECHISCDIGGLEELSSLQTLLLNNNQIQTVSSLQPLRSLKELRRITLFSNPICFIPHFRLIVKQILPKSANLEENATLNLQSNNVINTVSGSDPNHSPHRRTQVPSAQSKSDHNVLNSFSDQSTESTESRLKEMEKENQRLKTNIDALQRMLVIHEHKFQGHSGVDFKEWRNAFIQELVEHQTFLKQETENKKAAKREIKDRNETIQTLNGTVHQINSQKSKILEENKMLQQQIESLHLRRDNDMNDVAKCKEVITNHMLSINTQFCRNQKQWSHQLQAMSSNIYTLQQRVRFSQRKLQEFTAKMTTEKDNFFRQNQMKQQEIEKLRNQIVIRINLY